MMTHTIRINNLIVMKIINY